MVPPADGYKLLPVVVPSRIHNMDVFGNLAVSKGLFTAVFAAAMPMPFWA